MLKAIFFDLDGTLLRIREDQFAELYFRLMGEKMKAYGYDPELIKKAFYQGTYRMMTNDGSRTNEEVFWSYFESVYPNARKDLSIFQSFYTEEFRQLDEITEKTIGSKRIVSFVKKKGLLPVLSTNPIFPMVGQETRLSFLGLMAEDFAFVTSYENSSYCKPNPKYFQSLLTRFSLRPEEVIVFGNNDFEDGDCASALGIKVYLVEGYLIHSSHAKGTYETIPFAAIPSVIEKEIEARSV